MTDGPTPSEATLCETCGAVAEDHGINAAHGICRAFTVFTGDAPPPVPSPVEPPCVCGHRKREHKSTDGRCGNTKDECYCMAFRPAHEAGCECLAPGACADQEEAYRALEAERQNHSNSKRLLQRRVGNLEAKAARLVQAATDFLSVVTLEDRRHRGVAEDRLRRELDTEADAPRPAPSPVEPDRPKEDSAAMRSLAAMFMESLKGTQNAAERSLLTMSGNVLALLDENARQQAELVGARSEAARLTAERDEAVVLAVRHSGEVVRLRAFVEPLRDAARDGYLVCEMAKRGTKGTACPICAALASLGEETPK